MKIVYGTVKVDGSELRRIMEDNPEARWRAETEEAEPCNGYRVFEPTGFYYVTSEAG